jgi:hypothetical protein
MAGLRWLMQKFPLVVVALRDTGSFDFVRLAPHFAQDDKLGGGLKTKECGIL